MTPGDYELRPRDHMGNIMRVLRTPPSQTYTKVTFPEGFTLEKMGQRLSAKLPRTDPLAFMTAVTDGSVTSPVQGQPEGSTSSRVCCSPTPTRSPTTRSPSHVAQRMVDLMERVAASGGHRRQGEIPMGLTPYQVLIIASMIEKEAKVDEDRPKIARVIFNRLVLGMPLQIDATLLYGQPPGSSPTALAPDRHAVQHVHAHRAAADADRQPGSGLDPGGAQPGTDPSQGDPICADLPDRPMPLPVLRGGRRDGHHVFAATLEQHEVNVQHARDLGLLG